MCSCSSAVLHVSALCLSPCRPRKQGPGCAPPFPRSGGTPGPTFEGCPAGGPVPGSPEARLGLVVGGWPLRPLESCLGTSELWPGIELSPRLVYVAEVRGGARAHLLWARGRWRSGGSGGVRAGLRAGGAPASWTWALEAWDHHLCPVGARQPSPSFLRAMALLSTSCALSGPLPLEAPGPATSPGVASPVWSLEF